MAKKIWFPLKISQCEGRQPGVGSRLAGLCSTIPLFVFKNLSVICNCNVADEGAEFKALLWPFSVHKAVVLSN